MTTIHNISSVVVLSLITSFGNAQTAVLEQSSSQAEASTRVAATPTHRQTVWLRSTPDARVLLAEKLGEEGASRWIREQGLEIVCGGDSAVLRQGHDFVAVGPSGEVHVIEAKGGSSQTGRGYGYRQGTPDWAVKAAERTLGSEVATTAERDGARLVLEAAEKGKLRTHVVRTTHNLGEPIATSLEATYVSGRTTAELASKCGKSIRANSRVGAAAIRNPGQPPSWREPLRPISPPTPKSSKPNLGKVYASDGRVLRPKGAGVTAAKVVVPIAIALDAVLRVSSSVEIERQFETGEIDEALRNQEHARNWGGMAGGWGGAAVGAELCGVAGASLGTAICPVFGTTVGGTIGVVTGGVAGYIGGEALVGSIAAECTQVFGRRGAGECLPYVP